MGWHYVVWFSILVLCIELGILPEPSTSIDPTAKENVPASRSQAADPAWLPTSVISELQRGDTPEKQVMLDVFVFGHRFASREKPNSLDLFEISYKVSCLPLKSFEPRMDMAEQE